MSKIDFYTNPMSRGQIARWALHEASASYNEHIVAYGEQMHGSDYTTINPMGKVPAIVHEGQVVTECAAICAYLADAFPEANLGPKEGDHAAYYRWFFFASGPVESAVTNHSAGFNTDEKQRMMFGYGNYDLVVDVLEAFLAENEFVCPSGFTAADIYLGSQVIWGQEFKSMPVKQSFTDYAERLKKRQAHQDAKSIDAKLIADMQS